ncbi:pyridoxal phosphate-dependent decarboxylase family protein [Allonocardiopsis opalescens]|uniref:L-2,4-diaminobutyrate decarboxylase n=1 Tax=Allonocardiopsis opalescens TaxID=1144618 RepID=A0A2T0QE76_9ACTN|nr:pyridoxal-dependent decarboxylase [Allonocardiopsis opalescens]PRY02171.1 L-2,4-diaminobutyrate decarboxylase [Allonocardiopsis opalescens]
MTLPTRVPPGAPAHADALAELVEEALRGLADGRADRGGPAPQGPPGRLAAALLGDLGEPLPEEPQGPGALYELTRRYAAGAADPADPHCAAHLHCPPLAVAVAADLAASALNQSLDSWDQAPAATVLEPQVVRALAGLVGFNPAAAGGVVTTGGTESNLTGLMLARDTALRERFGVDAARAGVAAAPARPRILCGAAAHFSVQRSAALLGLGEDAVLAVPVDEGHRMRPEALRAALDAVAAAGEFTAAVVATAGTTDLGGIDPLPAVADLAAEYGAWLHVDAAYGGGALFSDRLAGLLTGLDRADSVALDLHKLGWQPVAAGVFLTRDAALFEPLARKVAYLNPADDEEAGYPSLLGRSLRTTRRADVFKIAVTLRALGRRGLGALVDGCHELAAHAARRIAAEARLELAAPPVLTSVVFRYRTGAGDAADDRANAALRRRLLAQGRAVVGRTEFGGRIWLKLTLLNPDATPADVDALVDQVAAAGAAEEAGAAAPEGEAG